MKTTIRILPLLLLPLMTGTWADNQQDCILEGTVDKHKAERTGRDVYVSFHSAKKTNHSTNCTINSRRNRVEFKQSKHSDINDAPHGATVKYRYTEQADGEAEWTLLNVSRF
ncbi:MAG: hypothetical protein ACK5ME_11085 [Parahaliea sp.]